MAKLFAALNRPLVYGVSAAIIVFGALLYLVHPFASTPAPFYRAFDSVLEARWVAISLTTQTEEEDAQDWGTLEFTRAGSALVRADCNTSYGPYALRANNGIDVDLPDNQKTLAPCEPAGDRLIGLVKTARTYSLEQGDLILIVEGPTSVGEAGRLRFRRCSDIRANLDLCSEAALPESVPRKFFATDGAARPN